MDRDADPNGINEHFFLRDRVPYADREGKPIDLWAWSALQQNEAYCRVAEDTVGQTWVSTIWVGLNMNVGVRPLIFETMAFANDDGLPVGNMRRYATEAEALQGHKEMVDALRADAALLDKLDPKKAANEPG
ncbi:MAG: hypothetical protein NVSMB5_22570 [Candidatus Velthaea sp.]